LRLQQKKTINIQIKSKRSKEELQHVFDSIRGVTRGSPKKLQKMKNTFEAGKDQNNKQSWKRMLGLKK
jgi:hypothetical protein